MSGRSASRKPPSPRARAASERTGALSSVSGREQQAAGRPVVERPARSMRSTPAPRGRPRGRRAPSRAGPTRPAAAALRWRWTEGRRRTGPGSGGPRRGGRRSRPGRRHRPAHRRVLVLEVEQERGHGLGVPIRPRAVGGPAAHRPVLVLEGEEQRGRRPADRRWSRGSRPRPGAGCDRDRAGRRRGASPRRRPGGHRGLRPRRSAAPSGSRRGRGAGGAGPRRCAPGPRARRVTKRMRGSGSSSRGRRSSRRLRLLELPQRLHRLLADEAALVAEGRRGGGPSPRGPRSRPGPSAPPDARSPAGRAETPTSAATAPGSRTRPRVRAARMRTSSSGLARAWSSKGTTRSGAMREQSGHGALPDQLALVGQKLEEQHGRVLVAQPTDRGRRLRPHLGRGIVDERSHEVDAARRGDPGEAADGALREPRRPRARGRVDRPPRSRKPMDTRACDDVLLETALGQEVHEQPLRPRLLEPPQGDRPRSDGCGGRRRTGSRAGGPRGPRGRGRPALRDRGSRPPAVTLCSISTTARTARLRRPGSGS